MLIKKAMRLIGVAAIGAALIFGVVIGALYSTPLSYLYCLAREEAWLNATNQNQLERSLFAFYSKRQIAPSDSMWGNEHVFDPGQYMIQYLIFAKEPLDVVFSEDGSIDAIYTSYE